jgi:protein TonB
VFYQENSSFDPRPLAWAAAGSLLLHLVLFWPAALSRQTAQSSGMLAATLRPNNAEVAVATQPRLAKPDVVALPAPRSQLHPTAETIIEHVSDVSPPAIAVGMAAVVGSAATEAIPLGPGVVAGSVVSTVRAPAPNEGIDADGLRKFRLDLATQARRSKNYPSRALAAGWRGTVEVRLTVEGAGLLREPELVHSSGYVLLDDAALDMLARAAAQTAIPESLTGRTFSVVLPVVFDVTAQ